MGLAPGLSHEGKFLKRRIRVDPGGWEYEHDPRHVDNLLALSRLDAPGAKGCATPGNKEPDRMPDGDVLLEAEEAAQTRT